MIQKDRVECQKNGKKIENLKQLKCAFCSYFRKIFHSLYKYFYDCSDSIIVSKELVNKVVYQADEFEEIEQQGGLD